MGATEAVVEYRRLGNSGLKVSLVGLGCNNLGRQVDADTTRRIVDAAFEIGINFIDTANAYGNRGGSEEAVGSALKGRRHEMIIATKGGSRMGDGPNDVGGSRAQLLSAIDGSLKRLQTDYVDVYQLHRPDPTTPLEETMRAMDDIVRSGRARYIGCSNFPAWLLVEANLNAEHRNQQRFISAQNQYSLLKRDIEPELGAVCERYGVGMLPFFPLAAGLLTGKYRRGQAPPRESRLALGLPVYEGMLEDADFQTIERLDSFALDRGHTILELAMSWLASKRFVSSIITGVTRPEQLVQNAQSCNWRLSTEDLAEIDQITGVPKDGSGSIPP